MAKTGGGSVLVVYLSFVALIGRIQVKGQACSPYASSQVLRMCQNIELRGQSVYLDTSSYNGLPWSCTCRMETTVAASRVVFDPVIVDNTKCGTSVLLFDYAFVSNCTATGKPSTYLSIGVSMDVIVRGPDTMNTCINLVAENPSSSLKVTCYESVRVTSSTPLTSTTTRQPPTSMTTLAAMSTHTPVIRACQATGLPVLDMCTSSSASGGRLYLDSSFYSDQYLSCTCSVQAVSQFGGNVEVYPQKIDNGNCNTNIYIDELSFYIGCRSNSFVAKYLSASASLDMTIRGQGSARHCLMLESSDSSLQVTCSKGKNNATSTTTIATTATTTTIASTTLSQTEMTSASAVTLERTSPQPSTSTSSAETSIPSRTSSSSTTANVTQITIESSTPTSTSATTSKLSSESNLESTSTSSSAKPSASSSSATSASTSSSRETLTSSLPSSSEKPPSISSSASTDPSSASTTEKPTSEEQLGFSVTGLIVGLVVLLVVILVVIGCCLYYRRKRKEKLRDDQKLTLCPTPEPIPAEMLEVGNRSVDNPLYYEGDSYSSFPKRQRPQIVQSKVISPFDIDGLYDLIKQKEFVHHTDIM